VNVLLCENLRGAADILGEKLAALLPAGFPLSERVGLVATSIGKMVPIMPEEVRDERPLEVWAEAYNRIVADADGFLGAAPEVPGLLLKHNFDAYVDRKLFIHNFGHAVAAYLGALSGHTYIWECMGSESLRAETEAAMWETGRALIRRYPQEFTEENQGEHIQDLLRRFANKALGDSVFRVGRDLSRKLDPNDRCIGALRLVREEGGDWRLVCRTIAAALCFRATDESGNAFPADIEFLDRLRKEGVSAVLASHCGISAESDAEVHQAIVEYYTRLREC
jgi:mannitol-1-phosphate 5-dehydrogenase